MGQRDNHVQLHVSCPEDVNGDGATTVADMLLVLGAFGDSCN